jgi:predicted nucleic acid-binding protein
VILLDTNVISALMQQEPDPTVMAWLDAQPGESIWTTSVTVFEVRFGLEALESGRRRRRLEEAFDALITEDLDNRVVGFDVVAAASAGNVAATQRRAGRPVEFRDVFIAGMATARKATLATRNTRHFEGLGLTVVDPWSS